MIAFLKKHPQWKLLLYWPIYIIAFMSVERLYQPSNYYEVHMPLDDLIPFCEFFVLPYMLWFAYLAGMCLYTMLCDNESLRRYMLFIIITFTSTLVIYWIFPTCQNLRPDSFARDNVLTRFMAEFYQFDTNTNVCPSLHVIGAAAVWAAGWNAPRLQNMRWKIGFTVVTALIILSTVFLKQHSIADVLAAIPLCAIAYWICYRRPRAESAEQT